MADMLEATLGVATQLDRALGYEANATGTSFIDDPLGMVGELQLASPLVTVTANRSAPGQIGTVHWDDDGVTPEPFPLVNAGRLVDMQTTREQAHWLAPYYQKRGLPVRSHGCAAAESALCVPLQHMPNLALAPSAGSASSPAGTGVEELVASIGKGVFLTQTLVETDFQGRSGAILGTMYEIKNGRIGRRVIGAEVAFNTTEFWKNVTAVGGSGTQVVMPYSQYMTGGLFGSFSGRLKGEPAQSTGHSVSAVAAVVEHQPIVDPNHRA